MLSKVYALQCNYRFLEKKNNISGQAKPLSKSDLVAVRKIFSKLSNWFHSARSLNKFQTFLYCFCCKLWMLLSWDDQYFVSRFLQFFLQFHFFFKQEVILDLKFKSDLPHCWKIQVYLERILLYVTIIQYSFANF